MKNIALKINNTQEADFCGQILKKIGFEFLHNLYYDLELGRNYLFLENGNYFFSYKKIVDDGAKDGDTTLVNSWREFILNCLGNFYYLCQNEEEKEKLIDIICENGLNEKNNFTFPIDMYYCYLEEDCDILVFGHRKPENKQEISLDNLLFLINNVRRFYESPHCKTMKTKNKTINNTVIHLKDSKERAAAKVYLEGFFKENELCVNFCSYSFMLDRSDCIYFKYSEVDRMITSWSHGHKPDKFANILSFADLEEFAQLIKEDLREGRGGKKKVFTFQNGLVAKYNENNGNIIIGCKEKCYDVWIGLSNRIIELQEDFSMSSYRFPIAEVKDFREWLETL